jgi:hypothetical protein
VAGRRDRAVLRDEVEDLARLGHERTGLVDDLDAGAPHAEDRRGAVAHVFAARDRRQPHDGGPVAQRGLDRGGVEPADAEVAAHRAADDDLGRGEPGQVRDRARREVVGLEHDRRHVVCRGVTCRVDRVHLVRYADHRLGSVVAVQVDRPAEHDLAHRDLLGHPSATIDSGANSIPREPRATRPVVHW